jgi:hypothetical protein
MERFDNESLWVIVRDVPVFDEHRETAQKAADGNEVWPAEDFDRDELEAYARSMNARDKAGTPAPITIGHTTSDPNEKHQPEIVGYARDFKVGRFGPKNRLGILATFYYHRDKYDEAKTFPRVSVERWRQGKVFDPIALLRRTPQRDLGVISYRVNNPNVVRYSMAEQGPPEHKDGPQATGGPSAPADGELSPEHADMAEKFYRHYMKTKPHMQYCAKCWYAGRMTGWQNGA